jgi:hypothetical protein
VQLGLMPIGAMHPECLCLNQRIQTEVTSFRVKRNQAISSGVIFICFSSFFTSCHCFVSLEVTVGAVGETMTWHCGQVL